MHDRRNPSFYNVVMNDPHLELSTEDRKEYAKDMDRGIARLTLPLFRLIMLAGIYIVRFIKRFLPFELSNHNALNKMGVWFLSNMLSPEALKYTIRHFQIETALINFVVDNSGSKSMPKAELMPTHVSQISDVDGINAVALHDLNMINHVIDTGTYDDVDLETQIPLEKIDFSALELPEIEHEPERSRIINFDIETASYIMVFFLVLFFGDREGERASLSLQMDESLMRSLSNLTGDSFFLSLCPMKFGHYIRYHIDVVQDLRFHMMSLDYAYHRLSKMKDSQSENN